MEIRHISSRPASFTAYISQVWKNRSVLTAFAKRNLIGKIAQTRLGVFIILIQVIALTIVMGFVIGRAFPLNTGYPYLLFLIPGMCGWYIFSYLVSFSGMSLVQHQGIITKVAFPRIVLPLSFGLSSLADFLAWALVITIALVWYEIAPGISVLLLPLFLVMNVLTGLAAGLWISILSVKNRDIVLISPLIVGFGIFLTPVFYPSSLLPGWMGKLLYFNPLAGTVEGYRCSFLNAPFDLNYLWGFLIVFVLLLGSTYIYSRKDGVIADSI